MKRFFLLFFLLSAFLLLSNSFIGKVHAQEQVIKLPHSNFDRWIVRNLKESGIIGGNEKRIYAIGATDTVAGNTPYVPAKDAIWGSSNVMAKVMGVVKGSCSVFPEERGNGYCVRMETVLEDVKAVGLFHYKVIATGSVFTGHIVEPVKDAKNPMAKMMLGIPFTQRLTAVRFDYKTKTGGKRQKASGLGSVTDLGGSNNSEVSVILQKRWEDSDGNVYAKRVGTAWICFDKDQLEWVNKYTLPINYGDITRASYFKPYMGLVEGENTYYCLNSKGKATPIKEIEWADPDEMPTHIVVRCSSGNGGAYVGAVGDILWLDNFELVE